MTTTPIHPAPHPNEPTITIEPLHLSLTQHYPSGGSHNIHLMENGDLGVIIKRGEGDRPNIPTDCRALVLIALGVDDDHDEVHFDVRGWDPLRGLAEPAQNRSDTEEVLTEAVAALEACIQSVRSVRKAEPKDERWAAERNAFELGRDYERGQQAR